MYHSITIGSKNTWNDWHLIPATRPLFNPPSVKESTIDIPGGDGALDLSTALSGRPIYNNRTGSWTFYVENDFKPWSTLYSEIMEYLHGQTLRAWLEDEPEYYYEGRFSVNEWKSEAQWSQIVIDYNVGPYKKHEAGDSNWLWDPFNFETDRIQTYKNLQVRGALSVTVAGEAQSVIPILVSSVNNMRVTFNGTTYTLKKGNNRFDTIVVTQGDNLFVFTGTGKVSINVVGGRL